MICRIRYFSSTSTYVCGNWIYVHIRGMDSSLSITLPRTCKQLVLGLLSCTSRHVYKVSLCKQITNVGKTNEEMWCYNRAGQYFETNFTTSVVWNRVCIVWTATFCSVCIALRSTIYTVLSRVQCRWFTRVYFHVLVAALLNVHVPNGNNSSQFTILKFTKNAYFYYNMRDH